MIKSAKKAGARSRNKRQPVRKVAGQPAKASDRYIYLAVNRTSQMNKALGRLNAKASTQREAVEGALLSAAGM